MTKEKVIDILKGIKDGTAWLMPNIAEDGEKAIDIAIKAVEHPEPHWIPVTERLPENDEDVLVQMDDDSMMVDFRSASSNGWFWAEIGDEPLAWMPLPEPYKGVTE